MDNFETQVSMTNQDKLLKNQTFLPLTFVRNRNVFLGAIQIIRDTLRGGRRSVTCTFFTFKIPFYTVCDNKVRL